MFSSCHCVEFACSPCVVEGRLLRLCDYAETENALGKKIKIKKCLYKVIFKRNPFYMDTLETTENNVVPMLGLVWRYSLKEEKEEDEDLIFILKNNI